MAMAGSFHHLNPVRAIGESTSGYRKRNYIHHNLRIEPGKRLITGDRTPFGWDRYDYIRLSKSTVAQGDFYFSMNYEKDNIDKGPNAFIDRVGVIWSLRPIKKGCRVRLVFNDVLFMLNPQLGRLSVDLRLYSSLTRMNLNDGYAVLSPFVSSVYELRHLRLFCFENNVVIIDWNTLLTRRAPPNLRKLNETICELSRKMLHMRYSKNHERNPEAAKAYKTWMLEYGERYKEADKIYAGFEASYGRGKMITDMYRTLLMPSSNPLITVDLSSMILARPSLEMLSTSSRNLDRTNSSSMDLEEEQQGVGGIDETKSSSMDLEDESTIAAINLLNLISSGDKEEAVTASETTTTEKRAAEKGKTATIETRVEYSNSEYLSKIAYKKKLVTNEKACMDVVNPFHRVTTITLEYLYSDPKPTDNLVPEQHKGVTYLLPAEDGVPPYYRLYDVPRLHDQPKKKLAASVFIKKDGFVGYATGVFCRTSNLAALFATTMHKIVVLNIANRDNYVLCCGIQHVFAPYKTDPGDNSTAKRYFPWLSPSFLGKGVLGIGLDPVHFSLDESLINAEIDGNGTIWATKDIKKYETIKIRLTLTTALLNPNWNRKVNAFLNRDDRDKQPSIYLSSLLKDVFFLDHDIMLEYRKEVNEELTRETIDDDYPIMFSRGLISHSNGNLPAMEPYKIADVNLFQHYKLSPKLVEASNWLASKTLLSIDIRWIIVSDMKTIPQQLDDRSFFMFKEGDGIVSNNGVISKYWADSAIPFYFYGELHKKKDSYFNLSNLPRIDFGVIEYTAHVFQFKIQQKLYPYNHDGYNMESKQELEALETLERELLAVRYTQRAYEIYTKILKMRSRLKREILNPFHQVWTDPCLPKCPFGNSLSIRDEFENLNEMISYRNRGSSDSSDSSLVPYLSKNVEKGILVGCVTGKFVDLSKRRPIGHTDYIQTNIRNRSGHCLLLHFSQGRNPRGCKKNAAHPKFSNINGKFKLVLPVKCLTFKKDKANVRLDAYGCMWALKNIKEGEKLKIRGDLVLASLNINSARNVMGTLSKELSMSKEEVMRHLVNVDDQVQVNPVTNSPPIIRIFPGYTYMLNDGSVKHTVSLQDWCVYSMVYIDWERNSMITFNKEVFDYLKRHPFTSTENFTTHDNFQLFKKRCVEFNNVYKRLKKP